MSVKQSYQFCQSNTLHLPDNRENYEVDRFIPHKLLWRQDFQPFFLPPGLENIFYFPNLNLEDM